MYFFDRDICVCRKAATRVDLFRIVLETKPFKDYAEFEIINIKLSFNIALCRGNDDGKDITNGP